MISTKTVRSALVLAALTGMLAACSSNTAAPTENGAPNASQVAAQAAELQRSTVTVSFVDASGAEVAAVEGFQADNAIVTSMLEDTTLMNIELRNGEQSLQTVTAPIVSGTTVQATNGAAQVTTDASGLVTSATLAVSPEVSAIYTFGAPTQDGGEVDQNEGEKGKGGKEEVGQDDPKGEVGQDAPKQDDVGQDAPKQDDVGQDAPKQDDVGQDAPKQDQPKQDDVGQDAPKQDQPKQDDVGQDAPKQDQPKQDDVGQDAPKQDQPKQDDVGQDAPKQDQPKQDDVGQDAPKQDQPKQDDVGQDAPKQDQPKQDDVGQDAPKQDDKK